MDVRTPLTMVWRTASSTSRHHASALGRTAPNTTIYHTRLLSSTASRRQAGSNASKQDRRDVADSHANPTSIHDRFEAEQEKQRANPQPGHNLSGDTTYTSPAKPEVQQSRSASQPIRTALGNRNRNASSSSSTSTNNLLSRFDNDSSLDFLTQPSTRTPRPSSSQQSRPTAPKPTGSLAEDLQKMIQQMRHSKNDSKASDGRFDTSGMLSPQRPDGYDPLEAMKGFSVRTQPAPIDTSPPSFRIGPSLGRTVLVKPEANMDLARAFRSLEIKCNANSIKRDFNKQRFHERGGTKRKRLASERWRRRFKEAFKATVRRVEDMRRKGW